MEAIKKEITNYIYDKDSNKLIDLLPKAKPKEREFLIEYLLEELVKDYEKVLSFDTPISDYGGYLYYMHSEIISYCTLSIKYLSPIFSVLDAKDCLKTYKQLQTKLTAYTDGRFIKKIDSFLSNALTNLLLVKQPTVKQIDKILGTHTLTISQFLLLDWENTDYTGYLRDYFEKINDYFIDIYLKNFFVTAQYLENLIKVKQTFEKVRYCLAEEESIFKYYQHSKIPDERLKQVLDIITPDNTEQNMKKLQPNFSDNLTKPLIVEKSLEYVEQNPYFSEYMANYFPFMITNSQMKEGFDFIKYSQHNNDIFSKEYRNSTIKFIDNLLKSKQLRPDCSGLLEKELQYLLSPENISQESVDFFIEKFSTQIDSFFKDYYSVEQHIIEDFVNSSNGSLKTYYNFTEDLQQLIKNYKFNFDLFKNQKIDVFVLQAIIETEHFSFDEKLKIMSGLSKEQQPFKFKSHLLPLKEINKELLEECLLILNSNNLISFSDTMFDAKLVQTKDNDLSETVLKKLGFYKLEKI